MKNKYRKQRGGEEKRGRGSGEGGKERRKRERKRGERGREKRERKKKKGREREKKSRIGERDVLLMHGEEGYTRGDYIQEKNYMQ